MPEPKDLQYTRWYGLDGARLETWAQVEATYGDPRRIVGLAVLDMSRWGTGGVVEVSTVFNPLPVDAVLALAGFDADLMLYETLVRGEGFGIEITGRYGTRDDALTGHADTVAMLRATGRLPGWGNDA